MYIIYELSRVVVVAVLIESDVPRDTDYLWSYAERELLWKIAHFKAIGYNWDILSVVS